MAAYFKVDCTCELINTHPPPPGDFKFSFVREEFQTLVALGGLYKKVWPHQTIF